MSNSVYNIWSTRIFVYFKTQNVYFCIENFLFRQIYSDFKKLQNQGFQSSCPLIAAGYFNVRERFEGKLSKLALGSKNYSVCNL